MKKIFISAFALLALTTFAAEKPDWAQLGRYTYQNAQLEKAPDVVFMGNSITDCWAIQSRNFLKRITMPEEEFPARYHHKCWYVSVKM